MSLSKQSHSCSVPSNYKNVHRSTVTKAELSKKSTYHVNMYSELRKVLIHVNMYSELTAKVHISNTYIPVQKYEFRTNCMTLF